MDCTTTSAKAPLRRPAFAPIRPDLLDALDARARELAEYSGDYTGLLRRVFHPTQQ